MVNRLECVVWRKRKARNNGCDRICGSVVQNRQGILFLCVLWVVEAGWLRGWGYLGKREDIYRV